MHRRETEQRERRTIGDGRRNEFGDAAQQEGVFTRVALFDLRLSGLTLRHAQIFLLALSFDSFRRRQSVKRKQQSKGNEMSSGKGRERQSKET